MNRTQALDRLTAQAQADPTVLAVLLFGSAARGASGPASDLDICLVLRPDGPTDLTEKRLEYLAQHDLDIQVFQQLPLFIRRRVLREGRVLLSKDDDLLYALALRSAQAFEDFKHIYRDYLEAVQRAGS